MSASEGAGASFFARRARAIGIAASTGLVVLAVVLAAQGDGGDLPQVADTSPHLVTTADLESLANSLGHPVYWAGERGGERLELTEEADGSLYLRYLPPTVKAGDPRQRFLTVGTYPVAGAAAALRRTAARKAGARLASAPGGGVLLLDPAAAGSVYLAHPGSELQVEAYDPKPRRALKLVRSGAIRPVG